MKDEFIESFHGFVKDVKDARTLVEACIAGLIPTIRDYPLSNELTRIRSGTVIVFLEQTSDMMRIRWRDGLQWSASKLSGSFLLYREVERSRPNHSANDYSKNDCLFNITASSLRPNTRMVPGGLAKRTVTITGTDGKRYR
ncbi:Gti1/Pac2 family-domain-containing protein [Chytriomyces sp. MP71]|nr:Gti1/Pac2 family-domain-containing protein [Chytriomyces sp. MP71]